RPVALPAGPADAGQSGLRDPVSRIRHRGPVGASGPDTHHRRTGSPHRASLVRASVAPGGRGGARAQPRHHRRTRRADGSRRAARPGGCTPLMRSRGRLAVAAALVLVVIAAWTTATSGASFTATKSNPSNAFTAASSF